MSKITKTFDSGTEISLSELFSKDNKIIIPDMQRDYCWGYKRHGEDSGKEIVSGFIDSLLENHEKDSDLTLGMLYTYENPQKFIHLCDGQQRITTLFLLLGVLYQKTDCSYCKNQLKNMLVSTEEQNDDWEPYLRYAIRENTLYFLQDLVKYYFIDEENKVKDIRKQDWYCKEYEYDPSIQSMIKAIHIINDKIPAENSDNKTIFDIGKFITFVTSKIKFFYYDMKGREHGEDMFVIINTTGESLTTSENIKPILLGSIKEDKYNKEWENRETFFWKNRENKKEHTADEGVKDFLTWFLKATKEQNVVDIIKIFKNAENKTGILENIEKYFQALQTLLGYLNEEKFQKIFNQIKETPNLEKLEDEEKIKVILIYFRKLNSDQINNILIPLLAFMVKFEINNELKNEAYRFLRRLRKNYFHKENDGRVRTGKYVDWHYILKIIEYSDNLKSLLEFSDFTNFENISDKNKTPEVKDWYDDEEKIKNKLKEQNKQTVEKWEDEDDFAGDVTPLFQIYFFENDKEIIEVNINNNFDITTINKIYEAYKSLEKLCIRTKDKSEYALSNNLRLFKMTHKLTLNGGGWIIANQGYWGYPFNAKNDLSKLFTSKEYFELILKYKNNEDYCKYLLEKSRSLLLKEYDRNNNFMDFIRDKLIFFFAYLEVKYMNDEKKYIPFNNLKRISCFNELEKNRININEPITIDNLKYGMTHNNRKTKNNFKGDRFDFIKSDKTVSYLLKNDNELLNNMDKYFL